MKRILFQFALWLLFFAVAGALVSVSGIVSLAAAPGHWPVTAWFLDFSKKRSVVTHSLDIKAPPLDDPVLVPRGAVAYHANCFPCHGGVSQPAPAVPAAMTPHPPYLPEAVARWRDRELFYIVKHGLKLTGMPAWPTQKRDDEVWAVVAFLKALPTMSEAEYRSQAIAQPTLEGDDANAFDLTASDPALRAVGESCARCHGYDGMGHPGGDFPILAGQSQRYLETALHAYAEGRRHSGIMIPAATGLSEETIQGVAAYYSELPPSAGAAEHPEADAAAIARGREIAENGIPGQKVPSCNDCHGAGAEKRREEYPFLAGQRDDYLVLQLELFKSRHRGGGEFSHLMHKVVDGLTPGQIQDVAAYFESVGRGEPGE